MTKEKRIPDSEVTALIEHLQGTIMSLYNACETFGFEEDDLTMDQLEMIDEAIFNCTGCGWWYEIGETNDHNDEPYCDNCIGDVEREDEDDEDDDDLDF